MKKPNFRGRRTGNTCRRLQYYIDTIKPHPSRAPVPINKEQKYILWCTMKELSTPAEGCRRAHWRKVKVDQRRKEKRKTKLNFEKNAMAWKQIYRATTRIPPVRIRSEYIFILCWNQGCRVNFWAFKLDFQYFVMDLNEASVELNKFQISPGLSINWSLKKCNSRWYLTGQGQV